MSGGFFALVLAVFAGLMVLFGTLSIAGLASPLLAACFTGWVLGQPDLGLQMGALCTVMALGFYTYGGATIPDYNVGAIFGTALAGMLDGGDAVAIGLVFACMIGDLMRRVDLLGRRTMILFQRGGERALARGDDRAFECWHLLGALGWFISRFVPVLVGLLLLDWAREPIGLVLQTGVLRAGLAAVGSCLPAVGLALLLANLEIKRAWPLLLAGYGLCLLSGQSLLWPLLLGLGAGIYALKKGAA